MALFFYRINALRIFFFIMEREMLMLNVSILISVIGVRVGEPSAR